MRSYSVAIAALVAPTESWTDTVGVIPKVLLMLGSSWAIGRAARERRAYVARTARQLAMQAVTVERLRIARELHDIVAHSMSLIAEFSRRPEPSRPRTRTLDGVTDREREVLVLIARGLNNAEIAEHLHLSLATVKTHVGRLLGKLQSRDRTQLVIVAYETGLVSPTP